MWKPCVWFALFATPTALAQPVTFSVNGPVDPHSGGIRYARGTFPTPQVPLQAGNPIAFGVRSGPVPVAVGLACPWPGDVFDFALAPVRSESTFFQSPPFPFVEGDPDGTNNAILAPAGMGLATSPLVVAFAPGSWTATSTLRDNLDAVSFGEDYFPAMENSGPGNQCVASPWAMRVTPFPEPIVTASDPVALRFSVDPWAIGLPASAVLAESGGFDVGAGLGPWTSPSPAAGDVFESATMIVAGGVAIGGGANFLVHDQPALALATAASAEDDLDALENVGVQHVPWFGTTTAIPGDLRARLTLVGPTPPTPGMSSYHPRNDAPVFFSVTRNSYGLVGSAVRSQFVLDGGAAADVFVTALVPGAAPGVGTNLLFLDEAELGLYAVDATPGAPSTSLGDACDDVDAFILWIDPMFRAAVSAAIDTIVAPGFLPPPGSFGQRVGPGMTVSIVEYLGLPPGAVRVGFSVSSDSIGLEFTAVDFEAGPVAPVGGFSTAAADVFYSEPFGGPPDQNWLWFEGADLGLDEGAWVNGISTSFAALSDDVDGLDSSGSGCEGDVFEYGAGCAGSGGFVPVLSATGCPDAGAVLTIRLTGALGASQGLLFVGIAPAALVVAGCPFLVSPAASFSLAVPIFGPPAPGAGFFTLPVIVPPGLSGTVHLQAFVLDGGGPAGASATNGLGLDF